MAGKFFYYASVVANLCAIAFIVFLVFSNELRGADGLAIGMVIMLPPLLSLLALWDRPDIEEHKLLRLVRKARLRHELKQLGGE